MGRLSGRLNRIKKNLSDENTAIQVSHKKTRLNLPGWIEIKPMVWKKEILFSDIPIPESFSLLNQKLGRQCRPQEFIFYDTETTGLSTGAGTYVFLTGWGFFEESGFRLIQLFLADYPGEPDYLNELIHAFSEDRIFISYNGRAYDRHVLNTRFLMNRLNCNWKFQFDLLYPSRALWKDVFSDCRLGTLEYRILGESRDLDIPGAEIPGIWLDFVKTGNHSRLENVFSHHAHDIRTLALLLGRMAGMESSGYPSLVQNHVNIVSWGAYLHRQGLAEDAACIWREAFLREGNRKAAFYLAEHYKRSQLREDAEKIWLALNGDLSLRAGTELVKYWEHHKKDFPAALNLTEKMLRLPLTPDNRKQLQHRYNRLKQKMDRNTDRI